MIKNKITALNTNVILVRYNINMYILLFSFTNTSIFVFEAKKFNADVCSFIIWYTICIKT